ncbi:MAG TPA: restriction endonuclease [Azospirillum sp.]
MNSPLMRALQAFEATEANIVKLERLWDEMRSLIPSGVVFCNDPEYEDRCRSFSALLAELPKIDGWKPGIEPIDLNALAQNRLDALEIGEPEAQIHVENAIEAPGREIREYRFRFNQKRRALIRDALVELMDTIDADIRDIRHSVGEREINETVSGPHWDNLCEHFAQVDVLLGSSVKRPERWSDLRRHLHYGMVGDFNDIERMDWPKVKDGLRKGLYGTNEPLPVDVDDLADVVAAKPRGAISTKLAWNRLDAEDFERLLFALISGEPGYENPEWLMRTNAPDRGRDLSVTRVVVDGLAGTLRLRVVIQCKHWLEKSVSLPDVAGAKEQMSLWSDPRVDVLVVATSGRFTADAVQWTEKHNAAAQSPRIEMWPESHLERLLAARPALIAEFCLRQSEG